MPHPYKFQVVIRYAVRASLVTLVPFQQLGSGCCERWLCLFGLPGQWSGPNELVVGCLLACLVEYLIGQLVYFGCTLVVFWLVSLVSFDLFWLKARLPFWCLPKAWCDPVGDLASSHSTLTTESHFQN